MQTVLCRESAMLSKHKVKQLFAYVCEVQKLLEELATDDSAKHFLNDNIEDLHFTARHLIADLLNKGDTDGCY